MLEQIKHELVDLSGLQATVITRMPPERPQNSRNTLKRQLLSKGEPPAPNSVSGGGLDQATAQNQFQTDHVPKKTGTALVLM